jgi:hypothetical protein
METIASTRADGTSVRRTSRRPSQLSSKRPDHLGLQVDAGDRDAVVRTDEPLHPVVTEIGGDRKSLNAMVGIDEILQIQLQAVVRPSKFTGTGGLARDRAVPETQESIVDLVGGQIHPGINRDRLGIHRGGHLPPRPLESGRNRQVQRAEIARHHDEDEPDRPATAAATTGPTRCRHAPHPRVIAPTGPSPVHDRSPHP